MYFRNVCLASSQLLCALFGGSCDETFSSYMYVLQSRDSKLGIYLVPFIDTLFTPINRDHCFKAHKDYIKRRYVKE